MGTSTPGTWPPADPAPNGPALSRRARLALGGGLAVLLLVVGVAVGVWAARDPEGYRVSRNGCVTVTVASSTGGTMRHECGAAARAWCHSAYTADDPVALLTRPQCRMAGLDPDAVAQP